jgi:hypothetical protein
MGSIRTPLLNLSFFIVFIMFFFRQATLLNDTELLLAYALHNGSFKDEITIKSKRVVTPFVCVIFDQLTIRKGDTEGNPIK